MSGLKVSHICVFFAVMSFSQATSKVFLYAFSGTLEVAGSFFFCPLNLSHDFHIDPS